MRSTNDQVFVQRGTVRVPVNSLITHLHTALTSGHRMNADLMTTEDREGCRWIGYGISKGVTHPMERISVIAVPEQLLSGLHGELIQNFARVTVDPTPACYEPDADPGFGGFVRWVLFSDPAHTHHVLGIDFSLLLPDQAGIANSMLTVARTVRTLLRQGIPADTEVALLNSKMCEPTELMLWRRANGLVTMGDWAVYALPRLLPNGGHCPRCGLPTLTDPDRAFCFRCGGRPSLLWSRDARIAR